MNDKLNGLVKRIGTTVKNNAPEICTIAGIGLMVTTVISAVRATPKAMDIIAKREEEKEDKLTRTEIVKETWKVYVPTACIGIASITCFIVSMVATNKRYAAITTAYALSESNFNEYTKKVKEMLGEEEETKIVSRIAQDKVNSADEETCERVVVEDEDILCYDCFAGRIFSSNKNKINDAVNHINRMILADDYASLNDFYNRVGLKDTLVGDLLGWTSRSDTLIAIRYSSTLAPNGKPCLAISFNLNPKYQPWV